jgi:tetratricopeptide (TPR) repeat protein
MDVWELPVSDRPRRLNPRYVLSLSARVQPAGLPVMSCEARNVGASGLFLATDKALELSSSVSISLTLPGGQSGTLSARVVHVLGVQKARSLGAAAGVGVQFEGLGQQEQALLDALVTWAREHAPRPRIVRHKPGADLSTLQHDPMLGFLLGYLTDKGARDPEALAEELALELDTIERMLAELERHGVIELVSRAAPQRRAASAPPLSVLSIPPPAPGPADGSDELIDFRLPPPPADAAPTAQHRRPLPSSSSGAREPSARALAAAAALRRPSRAPSAPLGRTSPPTAAGPTMPPPGVQARAVRALADAGENAEAAKATRPPVAVRARPPSAELSGSARATLRPGASGPTSAGASGRSPQPTAADKPATAASRTQPPAATLRPSRSATGARSGRPSRPAAAAQAEAAAQAAAEQAAAAAALTARGRPSQSPGPARPSKPAPIDPQLGAAGQILAQAEAAYSAGNATEASRHLQLLLAMTFDDPRIQARCTELRIKVMRTAAVDFEKQAAHEERQQHWTQAARSWLRVAEGRPTDTYPLQRAALAQLRAGTDLRAAMDSAKRAVELAPNDAEAHRTLAKVYVAADMQASARRELEAAQRCVGASDGSEEGPTGLLKRLLGRDPD